MSAFVIDAGAHENLRRVADYARRHPVPYEEMLRRVKEFEAGVFRDPPFPPEHETTIPVGFKVVFTIEEHPRRDGSRRWLRHMSMSSPSAGKVPLPPALEMAMATLGYKTPILELAKHGLVWEERIGSNAIAINVCEEMEKIDER